MFPKLRICLSVILLSICALAQDVKTDYDHSYNFSQLHTFATQIGTSWGNPLSEGRVKDAVTKELSERGWTPATDAASADATVMIHGATQDKKSLNTFYSGGLGGYGWAGFGGGTATTTVSEYTVGTLLVDIFTATDKKLVFRGVAQDEVSDKPEKNEKKVKKALDKMFKDFPPQAKP